MITGVIDLTTQLDVVSLTPVYHECIQRKCAIMSRATTFDALTSERNQDDFMNKRKRIRDKE
ncbi:hypothetical protein CD134_07645 [Staphylococcus lutrae]|uniref:Uncharacterized protein n=1 Tax=Staphylococcus lutrae TaxID=155085 RepID=A0AAC9RQ16_9STAP|nr:hypothetical protein B5P37_09945 [Staphylococcus lutrae]PNZ36750.1 hypothetical protein CD134_07645 [Staphylococcus lutrae]